MKGTYMDLCLKKFSPVAILNTEMVEEYSFDRSLKREAQITYKLIFFCGKLFIGSF